MKELFVTYSQAKELKELGMIVPCFGYFGIKDKEFYSCKGFNYAYSTEDNCIAAPLKQQLFQFFREKHSIHSEIRYVDEVIGYYGVITTLNDNTEMDLVHKEYYTYEQAESECIDRLIQIIKNK